MFIRPCYRRKDGRRHAYWALVESYRTERGPRQRTVAYLGQLDEAGRLGVKRAAKGNKKPGEQQLQLWEGDSPAPEWVEVDTAAVRVENQLAFGGPWLALQMIRKLQLDDFLERTIPKGQRRRFVVVDGPVAGDLPALQSIERTAHRRALLPQYGDE